jgi:hypothetical protein
MGVITHLLDAAFAVEELAFVLGEELMGELAERSHAVALHKGLDEQRLVDVAHPHLCLDEVE